MRVKTADGLFALFLAFVGALFGAFVMVADWVVSAIFGWKLSFFVRLIVIGPLGGLFAGFAISVVYDLWRAVYLWNHNWRETLRGFIEDQRVLPRILMTSAGVGSATLALAVNIASRSAVLATTTTIGSLPVPIGSILLGAAVGAAWALLFLGLLS